MSNLNLKTEIDKINRENWESLISQFLDASLPQLWTNNTSDAKKKHLSHIVIRKGDDILGCCQVLLRSTPLPRIGLADIQWGPVYIKKENYINHEILRHLIHGIVDEYAIRRGYFIRITPYAKGDNKETVKQIIEDEGFKRNVSERPYRTFMLDITPSLADLRKNFLQKWRNCLNKAEKSELTVVQGTNDELYNTFLMLGRKMVARKNLTKAHLDAFEQSRQLQKDLPDKFKMQIMVCQSEDKPICAAVCSAVGDTGIYVFAATDEEALKVNGSYLLQWHIIQWLKEQGIHYYDLGAFNPQKNPGGYHFKKGIAGKSGWEETFIGEYYGCFNFTGRMAMYMLRCAILLKSIINKLA